MGKDANKQTKQGMPQVLTERMALYKARLPSARLATIGIEAICKEIASGKSMQAWARDNGFDNQTVTNWIDADEARARQYAHARSDREDFKFEELESIGERAANSDSQVEVAGLRLKSDNLKWMLARMNAKKFGDKIAIGGDADAPPIGIVAANVDATTAAEVYMQIIGGRGIAKRDSQEE